MSTAEGERESASAGYVRRDGKGKHHSSHEVTSKGMSHEMTPKLRLGVGIMGGTRRDCREMLEDKTGMYE